MRVLRKRPGDDWELIEIENSLEKIKDEVGGHIGCVGYWKDACVICDEGFSFKNYPRNVTIRGVTFYGTILIAGNTKVMTFTDVKDPDKLILSFANQA